MGDPYSVSQINSYIRNLFTQDFVLRDIAVQGEVSNCTYHRSGHIYFTMKDAGAAISCVMFASARRGLAFPMKEGDRVTARGTIDVFERDGRYQLYAKQIERQGAGLLYEQFLARKKELEEMGMFAQEYKRPIPRYVRRLGIVTAPTGAAIRDIQNVALRRDPYIELILYPALVQGDGAKESIVKGLAVLDAMGLDCIIVGRGGGSIEDLWAFNEEEVARAIFACGTPVISAVGHETDTTIADFVADLRAPTPSAAAELAVADVRAILDRIGQSERRIQMGMAERVRRDRTSLEEKAKRLTLLSPQNQIREKKLRLAQIRTRIMGSGTEALASATDRIVRAKERIGRGMEQACTARRHALALQATRLEGLSPLAKFAQGYARATRADGTAIRSVHDVTPGDLLSVYVADGRVNATAESVETLDFPGARQER